MTAPLDEKARDAALAAWFANTAQGWHAAMEAAIRAYLAASPSPSEMEVDDFVRKLRDFEQAYSTEFFTPLTEAEKALVGGELRSRIAADMGRHLAQFFVQAADRIEALSAQVLRLTEENEALSFALKSMADFVLPRIPEGQNPEQAESFLAWIGMIVRLEERGDKAVARAEAAEARIKALEEALTPSGETKAAYMGEFSFPHEQWNVEGDDTETVQITVPWTTVKEVMAAIRARALKENAL